MNLRVFSALIGLILFCGLCRALPSPRVVNGNNALPAEFPYMASLRGRTGVHNCGATIIDSEWVLTAAHCIFSQNPADFSVQYGTNEITYGGDFVSKVKRVILHQGYDDNKSFVHDIALLQLSEPIVFNELVQPAPLPDYLEFVASGVEAELVGWGFNDVSVFEVKEFEEKEIGNGKVLIRNNLRRGIQRERIKGAFSK